jgi:hypothetical protein
MKALCRTRVGGVEISAIGLRPACLPALVRRWAVRRGGVMSCGLSIPSRRGPHLARSGGGYLTA